MPTYDYECGKCGHRFEAFQSIVDKRLKKCPSCGAARVKRLIGAGAGVIFKGKGFYCTDYRKKDSPSTSPCPAESKSGESKPVSDKCATCPKAQSDGAKKSD